MHLSLHGGREGATYDLTRYRSYGALSTDAILSPRNQIQKSSASKMVSVYSEDEGSYYSDEESIAFGYSQGVAGASGPLRGTGSTANAPPQYGPPSGSRVSHFPSNGDPRFTQHFGQPASRPPMAADSHGTRLLASQRLPPQSTHTQHSQFQTQPPIGGENAASGSAPARSAFPPSSPQMSCSARYELQGRQRGSHRRPERSARGRSASADSYNYCERSDENDEFDDDENDGDVTESSDRGSGHHHAGRSGGRPLSSLQRATLRFFSGAGGRPILHLDPPRAVTPLEYLANQRMTLRAMRRRGSDSRTRS